jgi:hypothetical protein
MYKLINDFESGLPRAVFLISENKSIPFAYDNTDYQAYLKWLDEGNKPIPADK